MEWPIWSRWSAYRETKWLISTSRNWKLSQSETGSKVAGPFLKMSFLFKCFSHIFAIVNQLPGFSIIRLTNMKDFLNVNVLFKCKYRYEYKRLFIWVHLCSMLPKRCFYCLTCFVMSNWNSANFTTPNSLKRFQFLK